MSRTIRWQLVVLLSAYFMAQFDFFVVNVAAPSFERSLRAGPVALELIVGGYAFAYAAGMITAGRLGDMVGHRRMFIAGMLFFTVTSLLCGLAQNPAELVTARLAQGLAGAMMVPQVLGTITATFPEGDRPRAIAWFGVTGGVASVAGQVFGGWLLSADVLGLGWRAIFLVNVPIGLLAAPAARRILKPRPAQPGPAQPGVAGARLDIPGAAGVAATLALVLVPLALGRTTGWPAWTWACMAGGLAAGGLTGYWQRRLRERGGQPVLETTLFRISTYTAGTAASVAFLAYFASFMFTLTLLLQGWFGLSPFRAGLAFAPMGVTFAITALLGRPLVARYGQRTVSAGCAIAAAGLILFTVHPGLTLVIVAAGTVGAGNGLVLPQLNSMALTQVPAGQAGIGSGMLTTAQQFAGSAGVTVIGTVFFSVLGAGDYAAAARATAIIYLALTALVAAFVVLITARAQFPTMAHLSGNSRLYTACDHSSTRIAWHIREAQRDLQQNHGETTAQTGHHVLAAFSSRPPINHAPRPHTGATRLTHGRGQKRQAARSIRSGRAASMGPVLPFGGSTTAVRENGLLNMNGCGVTH